jgi:uncharacterized protein (TIGR03083 family)
MSGASAALLATAYDGFTAVVTSLDDEQLMLPSRCAGWTVADVTYHVLLDAQRALVTFATPASGEPDVDAASYWAPHKPGAPWADAHQEFVRRSATAHSSASVVVNRWVETAAAAARAAQATAPDALLGTQGHVLRADDFVSTLVVEAMLHHLDVTVSLPAAPEPETPVQQHVRNVLDVILGVAAPAGWPTADYALAAGGRGVVPAAVRETLGSAADRFPLLG